MMADAATEQQPGIGEAVEPESQLWRGSLRRLFDQIIAEFSADHRTDLRNLLGDRPKPIKTRDQRGVQGRRDRKLRRRSCRQYLLLRFEDRFGQLLDEERHAVGALDDLVDGFAGEAGIAREALDQRRAVASGQSIQV
jgi:hypothetical protein